MKRTYKFLMRPTSKQADALAACLEDHRQLYNAALEERREAWRMGRVSINFYAQSAQLKEVRADDPGGQGRRSAKSQEQTLRRLDRAFAAFFRRIEAGQKAGYPRFKGRGWFDSATWMTPPRGPDGCRWNSTPRSPITRVYFKGVGHVRVHQHRAVQGKTRAITVKREADRWYVIVSCDEVPGQLLPATGAVVGIDMGVTHFLTTSDGAHVPNQRHLAASADRLAGAQRSLALKKRGSKRRRDAVARVVAMNVKVRRQRLDHAHKVALKLVRGHDLIAHEALRPGSLCHRPAPKLAGDGTYEPNGAARKAGLNKAIQDAGWGTFLRILADKAESAGRQVIAVNPRNTSRMCAECGHVAKENRNGEAFSCLSCGHEAHADVNAAVNVLRAGLARQPAQAA